MDNLKEVLLFLKNKRFLARQIHDEHQHQSTLQFSVVHHIEEPFSSKFKLAIRTLF